MEARNVFWPRRRVKPRYPGSTKLVPALAISLTVGVVAAHARSRAAKRPLEVMRAVDLDRYLGRWYEIAAYPNRFERGCVATTATYSRARGCWHTRW